jgi:ABC-type lipoprotein release transport system permease subunit
MLRASLRYYAATNALVVLGVAVAVAVLGGALLVGASVRESLKQIALGRLGATDTIVTSPTFFRTALADDLIAKSPTTVAGAAALIVAGGAVSHEESQRTAGRVAVYGIDERFGRFHGVNGLRITGREALISSALASELGAKVGDSITLRLARPTDIPLSSIQGRRESTGERIRLTVARILDRASLGEFSLAPSQGPVLTIYVPLERLQRDLDLGDRVNTLLVKGVGGLFSGLSIQQLAASITLDDMGIRTRQGTGETIVESRAGLITDALATQIAETANSGRRSVTPVLTYVANAIRIGDREVPYSTVTGIDFRRTGVDEKDPRPLIWLNEWAAEDLGAKVGDEVTLDYFLWSDENGLDTSSAQFTLAGVVPMNGIGGDQTLTPEYPGISDAADITSWDPPFPVDLKRVREKDEDYWDQYRGAPKAIVTINEAQRLWGSRYGKVSSLRLSDGATIDPQAIDPVAAGLTVRNVRADAFNASQGTTDFGEYFLYFSFFLVVSALLLAYLFFAVGLEQRTTEVGVLASMGFSASAIRRVFVREGAILAAIGAVIGAAAAIGYSALILYGLRTWWIGAVGTTDLVLHVDPIWLVTGVAGALAAGVLALWAGVRAMSRRSARSLLKGDAATQTRRASAAAQIAAIALFIAGAGLLGAALSGSMDPTAGFFGAGGAWLVGGLCAAAIFLRRRRSSSPMRQGLPAMFALGVRHSSVRPARSVLSLALIAFASFVLVSVGAFKKDVSATSNELTSGTGGFSLMAESVAPLMHDPNSPDGRDALGIESGDPILATTTITRFRLRPGDETSCLTLYRPTNPRIISPEPRFFDRPRFSFAASMAETPEERANPWVLLNRAFDDGAIAAIADQTTLMYVLHLGVGDDFTFTPEGHAPVRLRIVGALADSFLQSELIIGEAAFVRLFPRHEGYRVWMVETPSSAPGATEGKPSAADVTTHLEDRLSDYGVDVSDTHQRWASYHEVENTYLATFQALGSLGLLLGTVGLGAVLARNVLERRREIGLLRAVGFSPANIRNMVLSEAMALVLGGLMLGAGCALVAITPALRDRAQAVPWASLLGLLIGVVVTGLMASLVAIRLTSNTPVTMAIKSE